jgi:DNA helicase II / ATP-dependent DNA helicase PcrA
MGTSLTRKINLTEEQQVILNECHKNIYISAAPGSGKSTMLSLMADKILQSSPSNRVMIVTFTNKAAASIVDKCKASDISRLMGGTFHSIAYREAKRLGIEWNICDEGKKRLIIKKVFDCRKDKDKFERIYETISKIKCEWPWPENNSLLNRYHAELARFNLVDFDDIITRYITFLDNNTLSAPPITHILVDELQDTSGPQLEMLKILQRKLKCNMIGVADDDQSIYTWRGARPDNVWDFITDFKCTTLNMGTNFRSATTIVDVSKKLIVNNKKRISKEIRPRRDAPKGNVHALKCENHMDEIDYVVRRCLQNSDKEITILYRNRTYKNHLEFQLRKMNLKYCVNDMLDIADRSAIKVMLSCCKLGSGLGDLYELELASKGLKGIGSTTIKSMSKVLLENPETNFAALLDVYIKDPKGPKRFAAIKDLQDYYNTHEGDSLDLFIRYAESLFIKSFEYQDDMREFLLDISKHYKLNKSSIRELCNELGLDGKEEVQDEDAKIELSTVHGYKGLEREIVILPWAHMYLECKPGKEINIEDERRLFYVAITRAKERLFISYSGNTPEFIKEMKI